MNKNLSKAQTVGNSESRVLKILDYLYRFAGTTGNTRDVQLLVEDSLSPLMEMSGAQRIAIIVLPPNELENGVSMQRQWSMLEGATISFEELFLLGAEPIQCTAQEELTGCLQNLFGHFNTPLLLIPLSAQGQPVGLVALSRDKELFDKESVKLLVTACRQLAAAIENARLFQDLERTYRQLVSQTEENIRSERLVALSGLAATMAHEIRNPLATIFSSLSQIGKHSQISGDSKTLLGIAEEEALRLNRMVAGLLEFARPRVPRIEELPLVATLSEFVDELRNREELPRSVELISLFPENDKLLSFDTDLLKKAIGYLVDNALAAVNPGDGKITIQVEWGDNDTEKTIISVIDDGCGIAPAVRSKIFEPFFSTRPSGIGLGLSVARQIVEDHGGAIEIYSQTGKGTIVRLIFGGILT